MIPTKRSVIARLRSRSLEGGWSEDSLCRAARIRVFPRKAVMDRNVLSTKRTISSSWTLAVTFAEQYNSLIEFSRVGTAIFLHRCWEVGVSDYKIYVYIVASLIFMVSQILACQGFHLILNPSSFGDISRLTWVIRNPFGTLTPVIYNSGFLLR